MWLAKRRDAWEATVEPGEVLKPGTGELRDLRNQLARSLGHRDWFAYRSADYGMTSAQTLELVHGINQALRPLYRELHTWARYRLARKYAQPVPEQLPVHWLPDAWGADWSTLAPAGAAPQYSGALAGRTPESLVRSGEQLFTSMGFDPLPEHFWGRSSLAPVQDGARHRKIGGASAWHIDLDQDVRLLVSIEPTPYWYESIHRELGHAFYYLSYSREGVPMVLRDGAGRFFHEGIGQLSAFAATRPAFLRNRGLLSPGEEVDEIDMLLAEALDRVVFVPFAAGTVTAFEHDLYDGRIPVDQINTRWWAHASTYQGIAPPETRSERWGDGLAKPHLHTRSAQYCDYALATAFMFQLHAHIATEILGQEAHQTDYFGSAEAGAFLDRLMSAGAPREWQELIHEATGSELSADAMVSYYEPLYLWLLDENQGRKHTLPDLPEVTAKR